MFLFHIPVSLEAEKPKVFSGQLLVSLKVFDRAFGCWLISIPLSPAGEKRTNTCWHLAWSAKWKGLISNYG